MNLTAISITGDLAEFGKRVFSGCTCLTEVSLPDSLTAIPEETFMLCGALQQLAIPSAATGIGDRAFKGCASLQQVSLPAAVTEIEREGATLDLDGSIDDNNLVIDYAAWTWRKRESGEGMPRMLRYQLNNKILAEKMGESEE